MKKTLWMLGVAVAALTSCTESEVLDVPESRVIGFDTFVDKPTRAINDLTTNNLLSFHAYSARSESSLNQAFVEKKETNNKSYMEGVYVSRTDVNTAYNFTPAKQWIMNNRYRFAAYANGANTSNTNPADNVVGNVEFYSAAAKTVPGENGEISLSDVWGLKISDYKVSDRDLIAAVPAEEETYTPFGGTKTEAVNLTFQHLLAKVVFRFTYVPVAGTDVSGLKLKIEEFKMKAIGKGTCEVVYDKTQQKTVPYWDNQYKTLAELTSNSGFEKEYVFFEDGREVENITENNNYIEIDQCYVIPQSNDFKIESIVIQTYKGTGDGTTGNEIVGRYAYTNIPLTVTGHSYWKPGYVYRYIGNVNPESHYISFTASVEGWVDEPNRDQGITGSTAQND